MKNLGLLFVFFTGLAYGQNSFVKDRDFLRNYEAPDFKQSRLDLSFNAGGASTKNDFVSSSGVNQSFRASYNRYSNSQRYQGAMNINLNGAFSWNKYQNAEATDWRSNMVAYIENRFYFKPRWFIGAHGILRLDYNFSSSAGQSSYLDSDGTIPIVSIGNGRIEPIQYARNAMDIERQLKIGNRLSKDYSEADLKTIADKLAEINNVRFYDFRLRRIEQFKALDSTLREVGSISEFDIDYFVHLSDAYLYAKNFTRFSGFRHELGIAPQGGFYSLMYELPSSYAIQHRISGNSTAAIHFKSFQVPNEYELVVTVFGGYQLGWYPTTRTNLNAGVQIGTEVNDLEVGGQVFVSGDVYFTPRFRLNFNAGFNIGNGNVASDVNYFLGGQNLTVDGHRFNTQVRLSYAIF